MKNKGENKVSQLRYQKRNKNVLKRDDLPNKKVSMTEAHLSLISYMVLLAIILDFKKITGGQNTRS